MARRADRAGPSTRSGPVAVRLRPLRSVRVRITLAAVVVTAAVMAINGWLLVRSVADAQLAAIRQDTAHLLDQMAERLAAGVPPEETIRSDEPTTNLVEIAYEDGSSINLVPIAGSDEVGVGSVTQGPRSAQPAPSNESPADTPRPPTSNVPDPGSEPKGRPVAARTTVDTPSGEVTVTVAAPVDQEVARSLHAVRRALTIGLPLLVGLVALAAWWTVGRALHPGTIRSQPAASTDSPSSEEEAVSSSAPRSPLTARATPPPNSTTTATPAAARP